jgi:hypothetical protein
LSPGARVLQRRRTRRRGVATGVVILILRERMVSDLRISCLNKYGACANEYIRIEDGLLYLTHGVKNCQRLSVSYSVVDSAVL